MRQNSDWRSGLSEGLLKEIDAALDQLADDIEYESRSPKVRTTLAQLEGLSDEAARLIQLIGRLSPMAIAAVFEANSIMSARTGISDLFGDEELRALQAQLERLLSVADAGRERLANLHSPDHDTTGQGAGSARGRESDLRAAPPDPPNLRGLRSPKDKFAVAVLTALARHRDQISLEDDRSPKAITRFLNEIWESSGRPPTSWKRAIDQRDVIEAAARNATS